MFALQYIQTQVYFLRVTWPWLRTSAGIQMQMPSTRFGVTQWIQVFAGKRAAFGDALKIKVYMCMLTSQMCGLKTTRVIIISLHPHRIFTSLKGYQEYSLNIHFQMLNVQLLHK